MKIDCVGCQHRPEVSALMVNDTDWADKMTLEFEPENQYDQNAIAIRYAGKTVGYIPKEKQGLVRRLVGKPLQWSLLATKFNDAEQVVLKWAEFEVTE